MSVVVEWSGIKDLVGEIIIVCVGVLVRMKSRERGDRCLDERRSGCDLPRTLGPIWKMRIVGSYKNCKQSTLKKYIYHTVKPDTET